jgi:hypothetical protein
VLTKTPIGTHHVYAECRDCSETWDDYRRDEADARSHAKRTGHTVVVERGQTWTYNPKSK